MQILFLKPNCTYIVMTYLKLHVADESLQQHVEILVSDWDI